MVPQELWDVGAGITRKRGEEEYEETLRDHFKAPTMIVQEEEATGNFSYDFPKQAMRGIDPHFFMASCLAYVAMDMKAAPASVIVVPR